MNPIGPRVISVKSQDNYLLLIGFNNGEKRIFDAKTLFDYPVFEPLKNKEFFGLVKVDHGTITWPNDLDYCPDTLYAESRSVEN